MHYHLQQIKGYDFWRYVADFLKKLLKSLKSGPEKKKNS